MTNPLELLELMLTLRAIEEREGILLRQGKSWMQVPCLGHEALMALVCQLRHSDYLFSYYRGYHLRLAKGITVEQLARDYLVRVGSSSGGRSMSVHCGSRELNIFPDAAPVASQCLPAVGVAWGQKLKAGDAITVCSLGDGATRQGEFYEAVCFALQEQLPVLFLVEDNGYGISTPTDKRTPLYLGMLNPDCLREINGRDVAMVYREGGKAIEAIRSGGGPLILWCHVDRLGSHTIMEDQRRYRSEAELAAMTDPVEVWIEHLMANEQVTHTQITTMKERVSEQVATVYGQIEREDYYAVNAVADHLYADKSEGSFSAIAETATPPDTLLAAINQTLRGQLEQQANLLLMGQDIEDPKGGVFGLTAGLSSAYPQRVINSPIAEATILGIAVGLSVSGYRPVCEIQFIDFITPGLNQLLTHIGNLHWRSRGTWSCPLVIYAPYGAYLPSGGIWHSESKEGWWTQIPGLRVVVPATPADGAGLLITALNEQSPTLFLLPKHRLRVKQPALPIRPVPLGKANIVCAGGDVTVVAWGNCVAIAAAAAGKLSRENTAVEVIDLRTLVPCDWETIDLSLRKTGRLVVIHEDSRTSGFGATIIAEILAHAKRFEYLWAAPQLVTRGDISIPYDPRQEQAVLPSLDDLLAAIRKMFPNQP